MTSASKMDDILEQQIRHLENEVALLSAENDRLRSEDKFRNKHPRQAAALMMWLLMGSWGASLVDRGDRLNTQLEAWHQGETKFPIREGIDFATDSILRFTRIGAFRGTLALVAAIGAAILAIGQILILQNQNTIVNESKRIAATDKYVYFLAEEETARRLLGTAYDHWYPMSKFDLNADSSLSVVALREGVLKAIPDKSLLDDIVAKCGLSLYPVENPIDYGKSALSELEDGNIASARFKASELRQWTKNAADSCKRRVGLMKQLKEKMGRHVEVVPVEDESEK